MFFATFHIALVAGEAGVAHFVEAFGMAVYSDFPLYQGQATQGEQNDGVDIGNENQKTVLEKAVPIIDTTFVAATFSEK